MRHPTIYVSPSHLWLGLWGTKPTKPAHAVYSVILNGRDSQLLPHRNLCLRRQAGNGRLQLRDLPLLLV